MKSGETRFIVKKLDTKKPYKSVGFRLSNGKTTTKKSTDAQDTKDKVLVQDGVFLIPLQQADTNALQGNVTLEAQINYQDHSVIMSDDNFLYINSSLGYDPVQGSAPAEDDGIEVVMTAIEEGVAVIVNPEASQELINAVTDLFQDTKQIAQSVRDDADAGEFDGYSPQVTVKTETPSTYVLHIKDADHEFDTPNLQGQGGGGGTDYTGGNGIDITDYVISVDQTELDFGDNLSLTIDPLTFVLTAQLKHSNEVLSTQTIDLPLESVVVGATYDSQTKSIILTLESGQTTSVPVGELVSGLQTEITSQNKLSADLVDDSTSTNKFTNVNEKLIWYDKVKTFSGNGKPTSVRADYPNVKVGDYYIDLQTGNNPTVLWVCISTQETNVIWQPTDNKIFFGYSAPFSNYTDLANATNLSYISVGSIYIKNDDGAYVLIDNTSATWVWSKIATQIDLADKQDTIDSNNKLDADLVDDTNSTNKFVSASEKQVWDDKADETTISTDTSSTTVSLTLADNHEYRYTQDLTSLTLTMPSGDFIASIVFASGSTPTSMTYDSSIKWSGDDVTNGQFVPSADKDYDIMMYYNGLNINGIVRGV